MKNFTVTLIHLWCCLCSASHFEKLFNAKSYGNSPTITVVKTEEGAEPEYHLQYLALRGLADLPALILEASGSDYQATYYGKEDFAHNIKPTLPFGRLPVLSSRPHLNDVSLAQSSSIVRFLAMRCGLAGATSVDQARVDMWYETYKELFKQHSRWGKSFVVGALFEEGYNAGNVVSFKDSSNGGEYSAFETSSLALATFEESIGPSGWIGGLPSLTYVDLAVFTTLHDLTLHTASWAAQLHLPRLGELYSTLLQNENIADYLASERRMPKVEVRTQPTRDYWYVNEQQSPPKAEL